MTSFPIPRSRRSEVRRKGGFTLLEVTLALAIFSFAIVVLTQAFVNILMSLDAIKVASDREPTFRFIRTQVIQISDREELEQGGEIDTLDLGPAFWEVEIEQTEVLDLFRVDLRIELNPPELDAPLVREETLYLLRPTWSDPIDRSELKADAQDRLLLTRQQSDWGF